MPLRREFAASEAAPVSTTRRDVCSAMVGGTALLLIPGCGGGGEAAGSHCGASGNAITLNHGHLLTIAAADLDSTVDLTYGIRGASDHDHTVTLGVAQLQQLKAGAGVTVMASVAAAHSHVVTIDCTL